MSVITGGCEKCGGVDIYTRWHKSADDCGFYLSRGARFSGEHLHKTCRTCGYEWSEKPRDSEAREAVG